MSLFIKNSKMSKSADFIKKLILEQLNEGNQELIQEAYQEAERLISKMDINPKFTKDLFSYHTFMKALVDLLYRKVDNL